MTTLPPPTVTARGIVRTYSPDVLPDPDANPVPVEARAPGRQAVALPAPTGADVDVPGRPAPPRIATKEAPPLPALRKSGNIFGGSPFTGDISPAPIAPGLIATRFRAQLLEVIDLVELCEAAASIAKEEKVATDHSHVVRAARIKALAIAYADNPSPANFDALNKAKTISDADADLVTQLARNRTRAVLARLFPMLTRMNTRAAELLESEARRVWATQFAFESPWGISSIPSALVQGLRVAAETLRNQTRAIRPPTDGLGELAAALLEVAKDLPSQSATQ